MKPSLVRLSMAAALCCSVLTASAATTDHSASKYKTDLPPSADLSYAIQAKQSGITLGGEGSVKWLADDKHFSVKSETRAMLFGKILEASSEGAVDSFGLAPTQFINKRFRKEATTTTFHRDSGTIGFFRIQRELSDQGRRTGSHQHHLAADFGGAGGAATIQARFGMDLLRGRHARCGTVDVQGRQH